MTTHLPETDRLLGTSSTLVAAPMAGGPTTVALATAVAEAGAFPFLAGGYKSVEALAAEIEELRRTGHPFGVNLFVPDRTAVVDAEAFAAYAAALKDDADRYGLVLSAEPVADDDHYADKLALLIEHPVPVVSLTFARPDPEDVQALQRVGTRVIATVTSPDEARLAATAGVDGLVVQGPGAGGHSATYDPARTIEDGDTADLVRAVREATGLPIIATGGVDGPDAVRRLLDAGAEAVAVGTLLLRSDEAGTSATHRRALADEAFTETVLTRAFTGRPARALRSAFIDRHEHEAVGAYPAVHHLTRALRQAAGSAGDAHVLHLWAGTGWRSAPTGPAADIIAWLAPTES
ncbi:NAD(P)H-dependent flavin oxidoreductase [Stackebrandtia soli]|uniref:NAD(P)H-dependent flavin oxidoreductase n=1 Tax=Stackebrandtia soli TaxID=1892856 RepID=UPI0039E7305B